MFLSMILNFFPKIELTKMIYVTVMGWIVQPPKYMVKYFPPDICKSDVFLEIESFKCNQVKMKSYWSRAGT